MGTNEQVRPIAPEETIRPSPRSTYRELADGSGGVLLHLDTAAYHGLNGIGAAIWEAIGGGTTFGALVEDLRDRFEDPPADLDADVTAFLRGLQERDLVLIGEAPGGATPSPAS